MKIQYLFMCFIFACLNHSSFVYCSDIDSDSAASSTSQQVLVVLTPGQEAMLLEEVVMFTAYDAYASSVRSMTDRLIHSLGSDLWQLMVFEQHKQAVPKDNVFSYQFDTHRLGDDWFANLEAWFNVRRAVTLKGPQNYYKHLLDADITLRLEMLRSKLNKLNGQIRSLSHRSKMNILNSLRQRVNELIPIIKLLTGTEDEDRQTQAEIKGYIQYASTKHLKEFNFNIMLRRFLFDEFPREYSVLFDSIVSNMIVPDVLVEKAREEEQKKQQAPAPTTQQTPAPKTFWQRLWE